MKHSVKQHLLNGAEYDGNALKMASLNIALEYVRVLKPYYTIHLLKVIKGRRFRH